MPGSLHAGSELFRDLSLNIINPVFDTNLREACPLRAAHITNRWVGKGEGENAVPVGKAAELLWK